VIPQLDHCLVLAGLTSLQACIPTTYGYLRIPVENRSDQSYALAIVDVSLAELASRFEDFTSDKLAFYTTGREPIPYRLIDSNEDGNVDHARLKIPLAAEGGFIIATSDGPRSREPIPQGGQAGIALLRFDQAER
jgi:hypothetical protein